MILWTSVEIYLNLLMIIASIFNGIVINLIFTGRLTELNKELQPADNRDQKVGYAQAPRQKPNQIVDNPPGYQSPARPAELSHSESSP